MINRRTIFDHDDEAGGAAAVSALGFIRPSFRIEDAARMHGLSHRDGHFAVGALDFSARFFGLKALLECTASVLATVPSPWGFWISPPACMMKSPACLAGKSTS